MRHNLKSTTLSSFKLLWFCNVTDGIAMEPCSFSVLEEVARFIMDLFLWWSILFNMVGTICLCVLYKEVSWLVWTGTILL